MCTIHVGGERAEFLTITLLGRSHPTASDYWDGNWIRTTVEFAAGGFRGAVDGDLRSEELESFRSELAPLLQTLAGAASFATMEEWLSLNATGDGRGHIQLSCTVRDPAGNSLTFRLALDQTDLRPMLDQLRQGIAKFPTIGRPDN